MTSIEMAILRIIIAIILGVIIGLGIWKFIELIIR